ncbi:MAG TPA: helix-turn-helix transcriptional regulator [Solirubrobacteraceae bacterium]
MDLRKHFGENLRREREAAGLTQEELAHRARLHRTTISLHERGKRMPGLDTIVCLTWALELGSPDELLGGVMAFAHTPPSAPDRR